MNSILNKLITMKVTNLISFTDFSIIASVTFFAFLLVLLLIFVYVTNWKKQNYSAYFHEL